MIIQSIFLAVLSVVFNRILIEEGMIFGFWGKLLNNMPDKLAYPLGECAYCFGGQVALWYYFFIEEWNIFNHIFFVSTTIFLIHLILWIYDRTSECT